jgi:hypothetical protein
MVLIYEVGDACNRPVETLKQKEVILKVHNPCPCPCLYQDGIVSPVESSERHYLLGLGVDRLGPSALSDLLGGTDWAEDALLAPGQLRVELGSLSVGRTRQLDSNLVAKLLANLLEGKAGGLGPVEVENGEEDDAPADDEEEVLPADGGKADGRGLEQNDGC